MEVKFQIKLDNVECSDDDYNISVNGKQDVTINFKNEDMIDEYNQKDEAEQSQMIMLLLNDYIDKYSEFIDSMLGKGNVDIDIIEDSISTAIKGG